MIRCQVAGVDSMLLDRVPIRMTRTQHQRNMLKKNVILSFQTFAKRKTKLEKIEVLHCCLCILGMLEQVEKV